MEEKTSEKNLIIKPGGNGGRVWPLKTATEKELPTQVYKTSSYDMDEDEGYRRAVGSRGNHSDDDRNPRQQRTRRPPPPVPVDELSSSTIPNGPIVLNPSTIPDNVIRSSYTWDAVRNRRIPRIPPSNSNPSFFQRPHPDLENAWNTAATFFNQSKKTVGYGLLTLAGTYLAIAEFAAIAGCSSEVGTAGMSNIDHISMKGSPNFDAILTLAVFTTILALIVAYKTYRAYEEDYSPIVGARGCAPGEA